MPHMRTLLREHVARLLVRNGAWESAVFVSRATGIDENTPFPNVCIFTQSERTITDRTTKEFEQEITLLIEVREHREATMELPWPHVSGLANIGAQTQHADRLLDDSCNAIEQIIVTNLSGQSFSAEGVELYVDEITQINTDLSYSSDGIVPYALAQMEFRLIYKSCFAPLPIDNCPLTSLLGEIRHKQCGDLGNPVGVSVRP